MSLALSSPTPVSLWPNRVERDQARGIDSKVGRDRIAAAQAVDIDVRFVAEVERLEGVDRDGTVCIHSDDGTVGDADRVAGGGAVDREIGFGDGVVRRRQAGEAESSGKWSDVADDAGVVRRAGGVAARCGRAAAVRQGIARLAAAVIEDSIGWGEHAGGRVEMIKRVVPPRPSNANEVMSVNGTGGPATPLVVT